MKKIKNSKIGFIFGAAALSLLTGCVGYVDGPRREAYAPPPSVYVETGVAVQDDYVYYPAYQVYYSSYRHQYVYQDGRSWVSRSAPPHVAVNVLFASPSVNVGFHDSPANHHAVIARQYPKQWAPPEHKQDNYDERRADNRRKN
ncbi:MAG TPA: hypothetical protein VHC44_09090 [Verrucomicrobiae bacterium]|nr:hypothetical protein [Verrucomicrobiae bacterium]